MYLLAEHSRCSVVRPSESPVYVAAARIIETAVQQGGIVGAFDVTLDDHDAKQRTISAVVCRSVPVEAPEWTRWYDEGAPSGRPYVYELAVDPARVTAHQLVNAVIELLSRSPQANG